MKLIALDVGTKRIGVAKADTKVRIAIPYSAVEVNGEEFKKISSLARAWDINNFVLGLPRNSEGQETKQSVYVRNFAKELKRTIPDAKICFQDESLTSVEAEKRLEKRKKGYKKGDIDSEAAAIILQDFLEEKTGKSTTRATASRSKSVRGAKPHRLLIAIITLVILLGLAGTGAFLYYSYTTRPGDTALCTAQTIKADPEHERLCKNTVFTVKDGTTLAEVATDLQNADLIDSALTFQIYYRLNFNNEPIKAGDYDLYRALGVEEILKLLINGSDGVFSYMVLPGDNVFGIKKDLLDFGYTAEAVDAALSKDYRDEKFGWIFEGAPAELAENGGYLVEGFLFGDTYEFYRTDTAETIIRRLLSEAADTFQRENYAEKFAAHGLTLYEGVTLASVIQREASDPTDMARIAQIFLNRLNNPTAETAGMLGSDVTAKYAADLLDPDRTTYTDNAMVVEIDSPYNTRNHQGLPLGPISSPGLDALNAVATPDESMLDQFYFLTGDDGMMYYSSTADGHQQNILDHCQVLCNIGL